MRRQGVSLFIVLALLSSLAVSNVVLADAKQPKEWTFLVYLNGKNSLDHFGPMNIKQMEQVGSTNQVNIVVQWASTKNAKTQRLLVQKSTNPAADDPTSPIVQDMGKVDMGDWHNVVEFARWAKDKYPAKHYFLAVWDHGSGWHELQMMAAGAGVHANDISWDEETGNHITTAQLGQAITGVAQVLGQKLDIYGSDACLMAMAEVADEMSGSVDTFVGSQEVEPGEGWPYPTFLSRWTQNPTASPAEVGKILAEEYVKSYSPGGIYSNQDVTFSSFSMDKLPALATAVSGLGASLKTLNADGRKKVVDAASKSQSFTYTDYVDVIDFVKNIESARIDGISSRSIADVKSAVSDFVTASFTTAKYAKANGVSFWAPSRADSYKEYSAKYHELRFDHDSSWGDALQYVTQDATGRR